MVVVTRKVRRWWREEHSTSSGVVRGL